MAESRPIPEERVFVDASVAQMFVEGVLRGNGMSPSNSTIIADCLTQADDTHGISRIPSYMVGVQRGVLDAKASPTLHQITPAVSKVDGRNGFGVLAAHRGTESACKMAKEFGIGMVSIKHSDHFGMSAWVVQQASLIPLPLYLCRTEKISSWAYLLLHAEPPQERPHLQ